ITEDQLIGGKWILINGYEDGEIGGDPVCPGYEEGMEFIDEEKVYVIAEEKEISYSLSESDEGMEIIFFIQMVKLTFLQLRWKRKMDLGLMAQEYLKHEMVILSGRNKIMGGWDNTSLIKSKKGFGHHLLIAKSFFSLIFLEEI